MYKKGTILIRKKLKNPRNGKQYVTIIPIHEDMTSSEFFEFHQEILTDQPAVEYAWPESTPFPDFVKAQLRIDDNTDSKHMVRKL